MAKKVKTYTLTLSEKTCETIERALDLINEACRLLDSSRTFQNRFDNAYDEFDAELWSARNPEETQ